MKYVKLMPQRKLTYASRNKRELSVALECGFQIFVLSGDDSQQFMRDYPQYQLLSDQATKLSYSIPRLKRYSLILGNMFRIIGITRAQRADVISGHDLTALLIGYLSNIGKKKKAKLIYDSHEFELGRAAERSKFNIWCIKHLESFLIRRSIFSIMVNDSIADEVQRIHQLKKRPVVVRSTPNYWILDEEKIAATRTELCRTLGVAEDTFLVMYHGGVMPQRNVETLLGAVARNPNIAGVVLGNASPAGYLEKLKAQAEQMGISDRVLFHPAVPIEELYRYVGAVDVGTCLIAAKYRSYYLSLPNKFFENIQSMTPLVTSAFPEMKKILERYGIGLTVDITNEAEIDGAIEKMRTDKAFYAQCKENLKIAKEELCWEKEKIVLIQALRGLCL